MVQQYLKKGAQIYVEGQITTRKWKDEQSGQDKYSTEIVIQGYNSSLTMFCLLYTSPSPRDGLLSRMPSSA